LQFIVDHFGFEQVDEFSSPLTTTDCVLPTSTFMEKAPLALMAMKPGSERVDSAAWAAALRANKAGIRTATAVRRMIIPR
jgi:hypothetical protein